MGCSKKKTVLKNFAIFTGKYLCWSVIVQFNVSILNRLKCCFFLVLFFCANSKCINKHNVIFNKTATKLVTVLTKCFFPYLNPTSYHNNVCVLNPSLKNYSNEKLLNILLHFFLYKNTLYTPKLRLGRKVKTN